MVVEIFSRPRAGKEGGGGGGGEKCFLGPVGVGEGGGGDDWQVLGGTKNMPKCDTSHPVVLFFACVRCARCAFVVPRCRALPRALCRVNAAILALFFGVA